MPLKRLSSLLAGCLLGLAGAGSQAATFELGDDASFSIGAGLRFSYRSADDAPPGGGRNDDFVVDNVRLYMSGRASRTLGATLNFDRDGVDDMPDGLRVLDAYVQYEPMPEFNVWIGRIAPALDRPDLDGVFYLNVWDFPVVSRYPSRALGRDYGLAVWGKAMDGKLTYVLGAFKGHNDYAGASNDSGNRLYNWRVAYAFRDAEPATAYYTGSTYYGAADVLTLGFAGMYQRDGVGLAGNPGDYLGMNLDLLLERKLAGGGVLTLEGAYYDYDLGGKTDCGSGEPGAPPCPAAAGANDNVGGLVEGKGYLATAAFLFPRRLGVGQVQPFVRYQRFDRDLSDSTAEVFDVGLNYVIRGHDARLSAFWSRTADDRPAPDAEVDTFVVGVQFQI